MPSCRRIDDADRSGRGAGVVDAGLHVHVEVRRRPVGTDTNHAAMRSRGERARNDRDGDGRRARARRGRDAQPRRARRDRGRPPDRVAHGLRDQQPLIRRLRRDRGALLHCREVELAALERQTAARWRGRRVRHERRHFVRRRAAQARGVLGVDAKIISLSGDRGRQAPRGDESDVDSRFGAARRRAVSDDVARQIALAVGVPRDRDGGCIDAGREQQAHSEADT